MASTPQKTTEIRSASATLSSALITGMRVGLLVGAMVGLGEAMSGVLTLSRSARTASEVFGLAGAVLLGYLALGWFLGLCAAFVLPRRARGRPPLGFLLGVMLALETIAYTWPTPVEAWELSGIAGIDARARPVALAVVAAAAGLAVGHFVAVRVSPGRLRLFGALLLGAMLAAAGAVAAYAMVSRGLTGNAWPVATGLLALVGAAVIVITGRHATAHRGRGWLAVLAAVGLLSAVGGAAAWRAGAISRPNVVILTIDALRADVVGCAGAKSSATPSIDALAEDGVVFSSAFAHAPWTLPSLTSLMTGVYPSENGAGRDPRQPVYDFAQARVPAVAVTLGEALAGAGYNTAAVLANVWLRREFGLGQGIAWHYESLPGVNVVAEARPWCYHSAVARTLNYLWPIEKTPYLDRRLRAVPPSWKTRAPEINARLHHWLEQSQAQPFFLWAHYLDPHDPYCPLSDETWRDAAVGPEGSLLRVRKTWHRINRGGIRLSDAERALIGRLYRAEVRDADRAVGEVLRWLKQSNRYDNTLIVVTADHGEELFDHGRLTHAQSLYDELLHVPLVVKLPHGRAAAMRIGTQVRLIDIYPTICEACRLRCPSNLRGSSLLPLVDGTGNPDDRPLYAEAITLGPELRALRTGKYKLIFAPAIGRWEAYDLERDPSEHTNISTLDASHLVPPRRALEEWSRRMVDAHRRIHRGAKPTKLDEQTIRQLQALGYLQPTQDK